MRLRSRVVAPNQIPAALKGDLNTNNPMWKSYIEEQFLKNSGRLPTLMKNNILMNTGLDSIHNWPQSLQPMLMVPNLRAT